MKNQSHFHLSFLHFSVKGTQYILGLHVILLDFVITNLFFFNCKPPDSDFPLP